MSSGTDIFSRERQASAIGNGRETMKIKTKDERGRMNQTNRFRRCALFFVLVWFILQPSSFILPASAAPQDAVVLQRTHGVSCTVIATGPGKTYLLGCAHAYEEPGSVSRRIVLDAPAPTPGAPTYTGPHGIQVVALDASSDLSLLAMNAGPLPYVTPIAPVGFRAGAHVLSVGYDEMRQPATVRPAHIIGGQGTETWTRERPWHGRSGGALLDADAGYLIGVCSGYTGPRDHREVERGTMGVYVSADAIRTFLTRNGYGSLIGQSPPAAQMLAGGPSPNPPATVWTPVLPQSSVLPLSPLSSGYAAPACPLGSGH
jgi:hypothetical protein